MDEARVLKLLEAVRSGDTTSREALLDHYRPLALRAARQTCRRFVDEHDDEYSLALIALNDALDSYATGRGTRFESYAWLVIQRRLIDHLRRERRQRHLALEPEAAPVEGAEDHPATIGEARVRHQAAETAADLAGELERYGRRLQDFGLTLDDLVEATPKHRDTRDRLQRIARALVASDETFSRLLRTRRLPIQALMRMTGASRKVLETGRRYIIGVALALGGGFEGLRQHLESTETGGS